MAGILLLAVILRIAMLTYAERNLAQFDYPDSRRYVQVARHIADGLGPIDSMEVRSGTDPLYPAILALGIRLGIDETPAVLRFGRIVNVLASLASILLLASIGRRLIGARAGLIGAAILAVDPILLFFNGLVLTESLYLALLIGSVYCIVHIGHSKVSSWPLAAGFLIGLGTLIRSTNLLLPVLFLLCLLAIPTIHRPERWRAGMIFILGVTMGTVPAIIKNYRWSGHWTPVRSGGGASLLEAFGPWADGGPGMDRIQYPPAPPDADEFERDRIYRDASIHWIRAHPGQAIRLAWSKLARTWSITINAPGYSSPSYKALCWITVAPVYLLALIGAFRLRKRPFVILLLLLPAIYFSGVHMIFVGSVRYRLPAMPFLFLLAGAAFEHLRPGAASPGVSRE